MRIDSSDADVLRVRHFPRFIAVCSVVFGAASLFVLYKGASGQAKGGQWVAVIALPLMTLLMTSLMFKVIELTFDRRRGELAWSRRGLFERAGGVVRFDAIRGTQIQTMTHSGRTSYRLAVITDDAEIPLTAAYGAGDDKRCREMAARIDDFLTTPPLPDVEQNKLALKMAEHRRAKASA